MSKILMGHDAWLRHEEDVAMKIAEQRSLGRDCVDLGISPSLMQIYGPAVIAEKFLPLLRDLGNGITAAHFDGQRIYIYRRNAAFDIMRRDEAVLWFGKECVAEIDAAVFDLPPP